MQLRRSEEGGGCMLNRTRESKMGILAEVVDDE
jgi:predicted enzyme related to lactoylglutathione lyase